MCGIVGMHGVGDLHLVRRMVDRLRHRGPDDDGVREWSAENLRLGHSRLVILDRDGGAQPMSDAEDTVSVVFNGEIYNHRELRRELSAAGHRFRSDHSDTEVIVHGYKAWGPGVCERLNGMFAFAVFDRPRRRLFLARDRFGEKPLFYARPSGGFAFASEATALTACPTVGDALSDVALEKFFAYGFLPGHLSIYAGIAKLPAGHTLAYDLADGSVALSRYWRFAIEPEDVEPTPARLADWAGELRALLTKAVAERLESDVPLGLMLSGGIDSSAILAAACAAPESRRPPRPQTFTMGFAERSFDEREPAARVARHFGAPHREDVCTLDEANAAVPSIMPRLDDPIADPSIVPTYLLCRSARRHVTVALVGDGGDELFAGYDTFKALAFSAAFRRIVPECGARAMAVVTDRVLPRSTANMPLDFKIRRWLRGVSHPPAMWHPAWLGPLAPAEIGDLLGRRRRPEDLYAEAIEAWQESRAPTLGDKALEFYTRFYLTDGILVKADRASMMNGIELRSPFLDVDVCAFAARLPYGAKHAGDVRKKVLKAAFSDVLPADILNRPKKGFGIPLAAWISALRADAEGADVPGVDGACLGRMRAAHAEGRGDYAGALWAYEVLRGAVRARRASAQ